ncbi:MAG: radical SAM protein, partial [Endomicrobiaceae bacterium]
MISVNQFSSSKILQHIDRISEWKREGVSRPVTYELDMTNVCNCRCHFCFGFFEQNEHQVSMSLKNAKNILDQIKSFGGKAVTFTGGGDPLCNKDTIEAVKYADKIGLDVGFITNGILLSYEISKEIVKTCTWIRISLDAASEETYKLTHGMNSSTFKIILENVRLLVKAKKEEKSETTIGVGFLTYDRTVDEIVDFAKISKELGVDYAQYRPLLKRFNEKEFNVKDQNKVISSIEKAKKYSDK